MQIADVVGEEAELVGFLPDAIFHVLPVGQDIAAQAQNHGECMLGHRMHGVVADVGNGNAMLTAIGHIHHVVPRCGNGDHLQVG